jgi:hypothetical protein
LLAILVRPPRTSRLFAGRRQCRSGVAIVTLIDITVGATIRHNHNGPIASEAATARSNRGEAVGAERP